MKRKYKLLIILLFLCVFLFLFSQIAILINGQLDNGDRERSLIKSLQSQGYRFVLPSSFFAGDDEGKIVLLIHDADFSNNGFDKFVMVEKELGVRSAFYPRPDTDWFSQCVGDYQAIEREGWEIGFQYDCLSRANNNSILAMNLFMAQLNYMRFLFNVSTTNYHGDNYNLDVFNLDLYDNIVWNSLGLNEVSMIKNCSYFSDSNNVLVSPNLPLKDLVVVQLHTDWTK